MWAECAAGDADALGWLFARHADAVYTYCFRRTASWSEADDLVSVVFLEAWRLRERLTVDGDSALPLLFGLAHRITQKHHRSISRYRAALGRLPDPPHEPDIADAVAHRMDDEERMRQVREHLRALPRHERDVIELHVFGELDYAATAAALDIPVGTVRSRLSRARHRLRHLREDAALFQPPARQLPGAAV
nr:MULTISPECIES: RNA polymerase sigma factor [unclassified Streptomyces]